MQRTWLIALICLVSIVASCRRESLDSEIELRKKYKVEIVRGPETSSPARVTTFLRVWDKNNVPVAGLSEEHFIIYEKGSNDDRFVEVSASESSRRIENQSREHFYNAMLVLDLSGSVAANNLDYLKDAVNRFIDTVLPATPDPRYNIGIWWFDGRDALFLLHDFTPNKALLQASIDTISAQITVDRSTDLYGAVIKSQPIINSRNSLYKTQDQIHASSWIIFTDGTDQAARYDKQDAFEIIDKMEDANVRLFAIGLGDEIDTKILRDMGRNSFLYAKQQEELVAAFGKTARLVSDEANNYYNFLYCSPKRAGINELRIEIKDGKRGGFIDTTFDATGFTEGDCF